METPPPAQQPYNHRHWLTHVFCATRLAVVIIAVALAIGVAGYHYIGALGWIDALLEASMILGGMGPVAPLTGDAIKLFASAYAMVSGLVLVSATGVLIGSWLNRLVHHPRHTRPIIG